MKNKPKKTLQEVLDELSNMPEEEFNLIIEEFLREHKVLMDILKDN